MILFLGVVIAGAVAVATVFGVASALDRYTPVLGAVALAVVFVALTVFFGGLMYLLLGRKADEELPKNAAGLWDGLPCYISVHDRNFRIVGTNDLLRRDFGTREGELCHEVFKDRDTPCPQCTVREVLEDGKVRTHKSTVIKKDGQTAHIISTTAPQRNDAGEIIAAVEMFTDITELEKLREELQRTRRDYRRIFNRLPSHASVLDRNFRIVDANSLYRKDFGDRPGAPCFEVCKSRSEPCPECLVAKTFEQGEMLSSEETLTTLDGRKLNVVVYSMPLTRDNGEVSSVMEVFTDITEIKRLESELALMGRAVAGIAHRIKNILMGLEGGIFVLNTGMEDENQEVVAQGWQMVESNVERVSRIVKDLLYCSKDRPPKERVPTDPREAVREVYELFAERAATEGIKLRMEFPGKVVPAAVDPEGVHSLLVNLVANAIDACRFDQDQSKTEHIITLRCWQEGDGGTLFEVADNGTGISEDSSGKVFQDFFSTKGTEGTGIGLLVVKKVAEEHGGSIDYTTEPGRGTTFLVTIPPCETPSQ